MTVGTVISRLLHLVQSRKRAIKRVCVRACLRVCTFGTVEEPVYVAAWLGCCQLTLVDTPSWELVVCSVYVGLQVSATTWRRWSTKSWRGLTGLHAVAIPFSFNLLHASVLIIYSPFSYTRLMQLISFSTQCSCPLLLAIMKCRDTFFDILQTLNWYKTHIALTNWRDVKIFTICYATAIVPVFGASFSCKSLSKAWNAVIIFVTHTHLFNSLFLGEPVPER